MFTENQLKKTDCCHLGQILTYATGLEVRTVIWADSQFTDEHWAALDWSSYLTRVNTERLGAADLLGPSCCLILEVTGTEHTDPWALRPVGQRLVQARPLDRGIW